MASSAPLTITSGHGDFLSSVTRSRRFGGAQQYEMERHGMVIIADGVDDVLTAVRENMRKGAHFVKMLAGGSVSGVHDPLDVSEYSPGEIAAAAGEANRWGTYLSVHAYTDRAIQTALAHGAKCIEHGNLMSRKAIELLVQKDAWLSTQTSTYVTALPAGFSDAQQERRKQAEQGLDSMMKIAKEVGAKIALGTDLVGSIDAKRNQSSEMATRKRWFSDVEILRQATSVNGKLLAMSGPRNPYQDGAIGVIKKGAYADMLIVDGNPLEDVSVLSKPQENIRVIMKGGKVYKNTL